MCANVPGGCDVTGPKIGRAAGFPYWADHARWKHDEKILETGRYFDAANFAARVKCPALVSMGLIDETCPPAGVLAAFNQMKGPKEKVVMPESDHQGKNNSQAPYIPYVQGTSTRYEAENDYFEAANDPQFTAKETAQRRFDRAMRGVCRGCGHRTHSLTCARG